MAQPSTISLFPPCLTAWQHVTLLNLSRSLTSSFTPSGLLHLPGRSCSVSLRLFTSGFSPQSSPLLSLSLPRSSQPGLWFNKSALHTGLQTYPQPGLSCPSPRCLTCIPNRSVNLCLLVLSHPMPFPVTSPPAIPWFFKSETWEPFSFFPYGSSSDSSASSVISTCKYLQSLFISLQLFCPPLSPGTTISSLGGYNGLQFSAYLLSAPPAGSPPYTLQQEYRLFQNHKLDHVTSLPEPIRVFP